MQPRARPLFERNGQLPNLRGVYAERFAHAVTEAVKAISAMEERGLSDRPKRRAYTLYQLMQQYACYNADGDLFYASLDRFTDGIWDTLDREDTI